VVIDNLAAIRFALEAASVMVVEESGEGPGPVEENEPKI